MPAIGKVLPLLHHMRRMLVARVGQPLRGWAISGPPSPVKLFCVRWIVLPGFAAQRQLVEYEVQPGIVFRGNSTDFIPTVVGVFGRWEPAMSAFLSSRLSEGRVFIDVGANIGWFDLLVSPLVGASGAVVAIEASPDIHQLLSEQVERNQLSNVRTINEAVGATDGWVDVVAGPEWASGKTRVTPGVEHAGSVRCRPLDQMLTTSEVERCRVVKVDVEGAEFAVVAGLGPFLDGLPKDAELVIEVGPGRSAGQDRVEELWQTFLSQGFHAYELPNAYTAAFLRDPVIPTSLRPITEPPRQQTDVVFSRTDVPALPL